MNELHIDFLADCPEYLPALAGWLHGEWGHLYPGATLETRTRALENQMRRGEIPSTLVAHQNGIPMGTASLIASDLGTRPDMTPWLASVFVPAQCRKRGIAAQLVAAVSDAAGKLGFDRYYLWTDKEMAYYAKMGWKPLFEEQYLGKHITVMQYACITLPTP